MLHKKWRLFSVNLIILVFLFLIVKICKAQDRWMYLRIDKNDNVIFYDYETLQSYSNKNFSIKNGVKAWILKIYSKKDQSKVHKEKQQIIADCEDKRMAILYIAKYDINDEVLSFHNYNDEINFFSVPPESIGEEWIETLCLINRLKNEQKYKTKKGGKP